MRNTKVRVLAAFTALAVFACSSDTVTNPLPIVVTLTPATASVPVGGTVQLTAGATQGSVAVSQQFSYSVDNSAIATVSASGTVTGVKAGTAIVTAKVSSGASATSTITVTPVGPASITKTAGDAQTAPSGQVVPVAPSVTVKDAAGLPVSGAPVTFAVASGGGSVTGAVQNTNAAGVATVGSWTLATQGANTLTATVAGVAPVTFTATATAPLGSVTLAATTASFRAGVGGGTPAAATIAVSATGGAVGTLGVGAINYGAGPSGWLTATLNSTTAPATLTLTPKLAGLAAGTYTATVPVTAASANNSPQTVTVTFTVDPTRVLQLFIRRQPGGANSGGLLSPQPIVEFRDQSGALATDITDQVTATTGGPVGGTLVGVSTINAVAGVATYSSLSITGGGNYALTFSSPNAGSVLSDSITVNGAGGGNIGLNVGNTSTATVNVGSTISVPLTVDLSSAQTSLKSIALTFSWDPAVFDFVLGSNGSFGSGSFNVNTSNVANGSLSITATDPVGISSGATTIYTVTLSAKASSPAGGSQVTAAVSSATTSAGTAIPSGNFVVRPLTVTVP